MIDDNMADYQNKRMHSSSNWTHTVKHKIICKLFMSMSTKQA